MALIALLVGSRLADSPALAIAEFISEAIELDGHTSLRVDSSIIDPSAVVDGDTTHDSVEDMVDVVSASDALVVCTPVVKGEYAGLTKSLLELLPESALAHMPVIVIATGDAPSHVGSRPGGIDSIVRSLGGHMCSPAVHVSAYDITRHTCAVSLEEAAQNAVLAALGLLAGDVSVRLPFDSAEALLDPVDVVDRVRGGALLLDVRANPTQGVGLLPGAVHVQKSDVALTFGRDDTSPALVDHGRPIVVVCNSEWGSAPCIRQLSALGYRELAHVRGGAPALAEEMLRRSSSSIG